MEIGYYDWPDIRDKMAEILKDCLGFGNNDQVSECGPLGLDSR